MTTINGFCNDESLVYQCAQPFLDFDIVEILPLPVQLFVYRGLVYHSYKCTSLSFAIVIISMWYVSCFLCSSLTCSSLSCACSSLSCESSSHKICFKAQPPEPLHWWVIFSEYDQSKCLKIVHLTLAIVITCIGGNLYQTCVMKRSQQNPFFGNKRKLKNQPILTTLSHPPWQRLFFCQN